MGLCSLSSFMKQPCWDFPTGPVVKTLLSVEGQQVQSLVRELRSLMLCSAANKFLKRKEKALSISLTLPQALRWISCD